MCKISQLVKLYKKGKPFKCEIIYVTSFELLFHKKNIKPYNEAFQISQKSAFKILMKLIFSSQKDYHSSYRRLIENRLLKDYKLFYRLFSLLPYKYASYLFDIFHDN